MKSISIRSIVLFLAVLAITAYFGEKEINSKIEETIKNNYQTEIDALKEKLNSQSELINSIIGLDNKVPEQNEEQDSNPDSTQTETKPEFEYVIENGGVTITKYNGKSKSTQIPERINDLPVLKIGKRAFAETGIKSVTLPSSCKSIDWFAFYGCYSLSTVYAPSGIESIEYGAFDSCSKSLTIYCEKNSYVEKYAKSFGISYYYYQ